MDQNVDTCRQDHVYDETCQCGVPEAIICALEATSFEDAIRNAISLGGDADTLATVTGRIAEIIFGILNSLIESTNPFWCRSWTTLSSSFMKKLAEEKIEAGFTYSSVSCMDSQYGLRQSVRWTSILVRLTEVELAERGGFEPPIRLPVYSLSRRALSTTQAPLRN